MRKIILSIARALHHPHSHYGAILMLHRIDNPNMDGIWYNEHLKMSPKVVGEMIYWWEILAKMIIENERLTISVPGGKKLSYDCSTKDSKEQAFLEIRRIILNLPQDKIMDGMKLLFSGYDIDINFGNNFLGLTWDQVLKLTKNSLCTIGNHTYSHYAFTGCSDATIFKDIERATAAMKEMTGYNMKDFAFPYGEIAAVSQHDIELVKRMGFNTSVTTRDGFVNYGSDNCELPRIMVTENNWKQVIDRIVDNC